MGAAAPALRLARSDTFHMPTPGASCGDATRVGGGQLAPALRQPRDFHRVTCPGRTRPALYSRRRSVDSTTGHSSLLRIRFAHGHRRSTAHGDHTDSFVASLREPLLDNSR
jgi:hypothetical protein